MVEQTDERSIYEKAVQDRSFIKFILGLSCATNNT